MLKWNCQSIAPRGVIIGADKTQEWMLDWWYFHYKKYNSYPITICDFGLSGQGKKQAQKMGTLLDIQKESLLKYFSQSLKTPPHWEKSYARCDLDRMHPIWMLKPCAMKLTLFEHTIWVDLDCEIRDSLSPIFESNSGFTCALDTKKFEAGLKQNGVLSQDASAFNTGVIGYKRGCNIIDLWVEEIFENHNKYPSDQDALSQLIYQYNLNIDILKTTFNAHASKQNDPKMKVIHWAHPFGKKHILDQMLSLQFKQYCDYVSAR